MSILEKGGRATAEDVPADPLPGRRAPRAVREFVATEAAGGIVLLLAAMVALLWANSPWDAGYHELWQTEVVLRFGHFELGESLHHWVNDGLMAVFFFVAGLEIKRELVLGELRDPKAAAVPAIAAAGGMIVPALIFAALNLGSPGSPGWGVPMATDIAFAVGVVALLGPRVPPALKLFLLTLAIVDDIGAIVIIAIFYTGGFEPAALLAALALLGLMVAMRRLGVVWVPAYVIVGVGVWLAVRASGIHPTIAGVALGLLTPTAPLTPATVAREWASDLSEEPGPEEADTMARLARTAVSPVERLEHALHPWTSFLVVPLFALANAGVAVRADSFQAPGAARVTAGVVLGLVVGKTAGITGATWLAVRTGLGRLPSGATWRSLLGVAAVGGIGFTVALFISELGFEAAALQDAAKIGVLGASAVAAAAGVLILRTSRPGP